MQNFIFIDLDDTLFQTLRKCHQDGPDALGIELKPRAFLKDGSPISYSTPKQERLWQWFSGSGRIVPVTARDSDAFSRVDLNFTEEAILNHGAVILDKNRNIDPEWHAIMVEATSQYQADLQALWDEVNVQATQDPDIRPRMVEDFGVAWYGVIKHAQADETALAELQKSLINNHEAVKSGRLYCHSNGNNLAVLPSVIGKAHAVRFLMARYRQEHPAIFTVGMGDSTTDKPFMALCDYAVIPKNTQLGLHFNGI
jgi:hydroxymethylpyrimidine pyrophosphatase-like HAD family hydrolase